MSHIPLVVKGHELVKLLLHSTIASKTLCPLATVHQPFPGYAMVSREDSVQIPSQNGVEDGVEHKPQEREVGWGHVELEKDITG